MSDDLFQAASAGDVAGIEAALARGADIDWLNCDLGRTALIHATIERQPRVVEALLRHGASPDIPSTLILHWAPLGWAAFAGDDEIVRMLLAQGASVDLASSDLKRTALMTAAQMGHASTVALLLEAGSDPNLVDYESENAWSLARAKGRDAILPLLESAGSTPPPPKPEVPSLPWPDVAEGAERASPAGVVRAYILAMAAWEARANALGPAAARDTALWAEQREIVARTCTAKERSYPVSAFGHPTRHAAEDRLLSVEQAGARAEVIVLHYNGVYDCDDRFAVHRTGGEWRIDNLKTRKSGTLRWERCLL